MVLAFDSLHWLLRRGAINSVASVVGATGGICAASWKKTTLARIKMREDVTREEAGVQQERQSVKCELFHM